MNLRVLPSRTLGLVAVTACLLASVTAPVHGEIVAEDRDTLRGLPGVGLAVEVLREDAERDGLTKDAIQVAVAHRLRMAGIRVLGMVEMFEAVGSPLLYVNVNATRPPQGAYIYSLQVSCQQMVTLAVGRGRTARASTWNTGLVGTVGGSDVHAVRESVIREVDKFINDFLAVNPKSALQR